MERHATMTFLEKVNLWLFHHFKPTTIHLKTPNGITLTVTKEYAYRVTGGHHSIRLHDYEDFLDYCEKGELKTVFGTELYK